MNKKGLFKKPYSYKEALIFTAIFPIIGFIIELLTKNQINIPGAPYNIHILLLIIVIIFFTHLFLTKYHFFKWISTVPVAVSIIAYTTFLVLLMAFIPQNEQQAGELVKKLGLAHLSKNWAMVTTSFFLLVSLGLVILRRLKKFTIKNIVFILNHLGLWIIIAAGSLGSGDLVRLNMYVWENTQPEWKARDNNNVYDLPIAIKLIDFTIDEFNAEIALIDNTTGNVIVDNETKIQVIEKGETYSLNEMKIEIQEYYEFAMRVEGKYMEFMSEGAAPAAKIAVYDKNNNLIANSWISSESRMMSAQILVLDNNYSIALLQPMPKKYSSQVELFAKDGTRETAKIEVNKPYNFKGWKIYQIDYNVERGQWSELSVLELVRDPWIPIVYIGFFMVLIGSVYLFWIGKKEKK